MVILTISSISNNLAGACIHKPLQLYRLQVVKKINYRFSTTCNFAIK